MRVKHQYTVEFKMNHLGYGEWIEEPDLVEFSYKDYECMVKRVIEKEPYTPIEHYFGGHLCGYVLVPSDHPLHHKKYEEMGIDCHFGLTFGEVSNGHWIGFDCGHCIDFVPSIEKFRNESPELKSLNQKMMENFKDIFENNVLFNRTYRNIEFCVKQCESIVDQLIELKIGALEEKNKMS